MSKEKTLGQVGFDAYGDRAEWKAFDGRPMPRWDDNLRADIKDKWEIAAEAIAAKAIEPYVAILDELAEAMADPGVSGTVSDLGQMCFDLRDKMIALVQAKKV